MSALAIPTSAGRRFVTLDAMRGVAALLVVFYHLGQLGIGYELRFGYLAVDLFFILSGFVLAYANDRRFASGQTLKAFMWARIKRLGPLYALGVAAGVFAMAVGVSHGLSGPKLWIGAGLNAVGLPSPFPTNGGSAFPLNGPFWSLFFEFWIANLLFGLFWRQLQGKHLYALIAIFALGLMFCEKHFYTVDVGWGVQNIAGGFVRVGFSFFAGVALARWHSARPMGLRIPSVAVLLGLLVVIVIPLQGRAAHLFELAAVLIAFPAMIYVAADAIEKRPEVGNLLGNASYAIYTIHFPIVLVIANLLGKPGAILGLLIQATLTAALFIASVGFARADEAIRRAIPA